MGATTDFIHVCGSYCSRLVPFVHQLVDVTEGLDSQFGQVLNIGPQDRVLPKCVTSWMGGWMGGQVGWEGRLDGGQVGWEGRLNGRAGWMEGRLDGRAG